jgi:hypothetical protein
MMRIPDSCLLVILVATQIATLPAQGVEVSVAGIPGHGINAYASRCGSASIARHRDGPCTMLEHIVAEWPSKGRRPSESWANATQRLTATLHRELAYNPDDQFTSDLLSAMLLELTAFPQSIQWPAMPVEQIAGSLGKAVQAGVQTLATYRGCVSAALSVRDYPTARYCSHRALASGIDSTWHALRLSWLAFRAGNEHEGDRWLQHAFASDHSAADLEDLSLLVRYLGAGNRSVTAGSSRELALELTTLAREPDSRTLSPFLIRLSELGGEDESPNRTRLSQFRTLSYWGFGFVGCISRVIPDNYNLRPRKTPCNTEQQPWGRPLRSHIAARLFHRWDGRTGTPVVVIGIRPPDREIPPPSIAELRMWNAGQDTSLVDMKVEMLRGGKNTAVVSVPTQHRADAWSLRVPRENGTGSWASADAGQFRYPAGGIEISDLILADPATAAILIEGQDTVLVPTDSTATRETQPVLDFQVKVRSALDAQIRIGVTPWRNGSSDESITLVHGIRLAAGVSRFQRTIDLSRLPKGEYRLRVEVSPGDADAATASEVGFFLE